MFLNDSSVKDRLCGVGVLSRQDAYDLGCAGPMLRASGVAQDASSVTRLSNTWNLNPSPAPKATPMPGAVRCQELFQSNDLIRQALAQIPAGEIAVKVTGNPNGEVIARTEHPRGEGAYCVKANGTKNLQRFRVRTPTFANLPAMVKVLQRCDLADVAVLVRTIDPCISSTER